MKNEFLLYLAEACTGIMLVAFVYRFLLEKLTFFTWNRYYLVAGILMSMLLPLLPIPASFDESEKSAVITGGFYPINIPLNFYFKSWTDSGATTNAYDGAFVVYLVFFVLYLTGVVYKFWKLLAGVYSLVRLKRKAERCEIGAFYTVYMQSALPTFSFGRNIFLHTDTQLLTQWEREQILLHEQTHIALKHSYDLMLIEAAGILFWFNPCIPYLARAIRKIHEYQVDRHVTSVQRNTVDYGRLLVKLASRQSRMPMINTFSDSQIFDRITMLTKTKSKSMQKLKFLSLLPVTASIVLLCSCFEMNNKGPADSATIPAGQTSSANGPAIGSITWKGNTKYTAAELNEILQFRPGDAYDSTLFDNSLRFLPDGKDVVSYYMDQGYIFFRIETHENFRDNKVDLTLDVTEGQKARIGKVLLKGNKKISSAKILDLIDVKAGDSFSRSKIISSQRKLAEMGAFDVKSIQINPVPDHESFAKAEVGSVDIEFAVNEL